MIKTFLTDIPLILLIGFISFSIGEKIINLLKCKFAVASEKIISSLCVGLVVISYITFFLGIIGLLYKWLSFAILIVFLFLFRKRLASCILQLVKTIKKIKEYFSNLSTFEIFLISILSAAAFCNLLFNYTPPTEVDELAYQISLPKLYVENKKIVERPDIWGSYFPSSIHMIFTFLMMLGNPMTAKLSVYFMSLLVAITVYVLSKGFMERKYALLACVFYYVMPHTISFTGKTSTDFGLQLYGILSILALKNYPYSKSINWFILGGILAGMGVACRPYGIAAAVSVGVVFLFFIKEKMHTKIKLSISYFLPIVLILSPWIVRNYLLTGNPFYPKALLPNLPADEFFTRWQEGFTASKNFFTHLYSLPYGGLVLGCGVLPLGFIPLLLVVGKLNTIVSILLFVGLLNLLMMFYFFAQPVRYSAFSFPIFCSISAYTVSEILQQQRRLLKTFIYLVIILPILFPNLSLSLYFGLKRFPVFVGKTSTEEYLIKEYDYLETYHGVKFINTNIPKGEKIFFVGPLWGPQFFYPNHTIYGIGKYKPDFYTQPLQEIVNQLKKDKIKFIVFTKDELFRELEEGKYQHTDPSNTGIIISWPKPDKYFELIHKLVSSRGKVEFYKIKYE